VRAPFAAALVILVLLAAALLPCSAALAADMDADGAADHHRLPCCVEVGASGGDHPALSAPGERRSEPAVPQAQAEAPAAAGPARAPGHRLRTAGSGAASPPPKGQLTYLLTLRLRL
jgi:hypothetical protein